MKMQAEGNIGVKGNGARKVGGGRHHAQVPGHDPGIMPGTHITAGLAGALGVEKSRPKIPTPPRSQTREFSVVTRACYRYTTEHPPIKLKIQIIIKIIK